MEQLITSNSDWLFCISLILIPFASVVVIVSQLTMIRVLRELNMDLAKQASTIDKIFKLIRYRRSQELLDFLNRKTVSRK